MAVPKKKVSTSKKKIRNTDSSKKIQRIDYIICFNCHMIKLKHHICSQCGYYHNRSRLIDNTNQPIIYK